MFIIASFGNVRNEMRKILLTSAGFETKHIIEVFHGLFDKKPAEIKALFIPTAANSQSGIEFLPKCMNDLIKAGILSEYICVFDLHRNMDVDELLKYDVVYFTGGSSEYLLERINDTGFNKSLKQYIDKGGVYVGVSAGSIVAVNNLSDGLNLVNCTLDVHTSSGTEVGLINTDENPHIDLTDENVILILGDKCEVMK
jgi:Peptidase E